MRVVLLLLLLVASPAFAQSGSQRPAIVYSGEHGPFTRLVVRFPKPLDWALQRISGGYALSVTGLVGLRICLGRSASSRGTASRISW